MINPLTDEHRQCFEAICDSAKDTMDLIDRCETCTKTDMSEVRKQLADQVDTARALLKSFFNVDR